MNQKKLTTTEINAALESIEVCQKTALSLALTIVEKIRQRNNNNADMRKADWIVELKELEDKMIFYDQLAYELRSVITTCSDSNLLPVFDVDAVLKQVDKNTEDGKTPNLHKKAEAILEAKGIKRIGTKHGNVEDLS